MQTEEEKKRKTKAVIVTIVFHAVALILFIFFGLKQPNPLPEDAGASVEFGWDEDAGGPDIVSPTQQVQQPETVQESQPEVVEDPVDEVAEETESEIAVPKPKEEKPKPVEEKKPEKPVEKPKPKPTISDQLNDALQSLNETNNPGTGQGQTTGDGDQGNPDGNEGDGMIGSGSGSWQLDGRSMLPGYGTKISTTKEEGIVVLNIWVDKNGKVTKVQPNLRESNTTSQYLINLAKNDVLNNFKFNGDPDAAISQRGKVRYVFQLK
ncbi:MAG: cell envelope integrity protein TolA [Cryomorphaceae bacterium]